MSLLPALFGRTALSTVALSTVVVSLSVGGAATASAEELRILAWEGYADPDWVEAFEEQTGADVSVVFIGTDDEIWAKIAGSEGEDFDLFAVNTAQLQRYIDAGLATPHDMSKLPHAQNMLPQFKDLSQVSGTMRDGEVFGIPYAFDSIGLIYDVDAFPTPPTSWSVMWDPQYQGRTLMYDNGEHNFSVAALEEGIADPFHLSEQQMVELKDLLIDEVHNSLSLYTTADEATQIYMTNDVVLLFANYGQQQVRSMQDADANVAYVNPKEGALAWLDTWALTSGVRNVDLAEQWVNFVLTEQIGTQLTERTGFGNVMVPSGAAGADDKLVWLEAVENPTLRSDMWNEVKAAQ